MPVDTVQSDFSRGIIRDLPRDQLPTNSMYECINMIPNIGAVPLRNRAPWTYASSVLPVGAYVQAGIHAAYIGADQILIVNSANGVNRISSTGTVTTLTSLGSSMAQNPVFFKNFVYFPDTAGVKKVDSAGTQIGIDKYNGSGIVAGGFGSTYIVQHKDRLVFGNATIPAATNRVHYSDANNGDLVDIINNYFDFDRPITGLASTRSGVLVFHSRATYILRGSVPGADGDITREFLFPVGCSDAFSITSWNEYSIWADVKGVYMSDGGTFVDLTQAGGIKTAWSVPSVGGQGLFDARICASVTGDYLVVTVFNPNNASEIQTWLCHIPDRSWVKFSNYPFRCYFPSTSGGLYAGSGAEGRLANAGGFLGQGTTGSDANGVAVASQWTMRYIQPSIGKHRLRAAYLSYSLRDTAATTLTASFSTDRRTVGAFDASTTTLARTDTSTTNTAEGFTRTAIPINREGSGVVLNFATNGSSTLRELDIWGVDLDFWTTDPHRR